MSLELVPITLDEANQFIYERHRHNLEVFAGMQARFCIAVASENKIVGVAVVGRPVARFNCDDWTIEVGRTCTDGTKNANSILYGACWRAAKALGYRRLLTYSLPEESGASLRAAGWVCLGKAGGGAWTNKKRKRRDKHPLGKKLKWEKRENWKDMPRPKVDTTPGQMSLFDTLDTSVEELYNGMDAISVTEKENEENGSEHETETDGGPTGSTRRLCQQDESQEREDSAEDSRQAEVQSEGEERDGGQLADR